MCGIAGWYRRGGLPVERSVIAAQCATIFHRGPDDEGIFVDGDIGFGMRLSILDVAGGHQPIWSPDGRYAIVYNGEVFNHEVLRKELSEAGHTFRTHSDTETVLMGFVAWGDAVWARLEGMFAVALWDRQKRSLRLVRDPLGIKPLFYTQQHGGIAFASELKALAPIPGLTFLVRAEAIDSFFCFGHVQGPQSIYQHVLKLEPGHVLTIPSSGEPQSHRFWSLRFRTHDQRSEAEWIEEFREVFLATVRRHLQADVPYGAFLSGGVDSSAIVGAMSQITRSPVRTFTIGFADPRYDESPYAATVAKHLGCQHTMRRVELTEAAKLLPVLANCYDEPFADPSSVPTWYLSQLAREQVTVALAGDGGDELFAGYQRHYNERLVQQFKLLPGPLRSLVGLVQVLPRLPNQRWNYFRQRLRKVHHDAQLPSTYQRFFSKNQISSQAARAALFDVALMDQLNPEEELARLERQFLPEKVSTDPVENLLYADTVVRLPDAMLVKVDRASMAHSLEVRVPFLSHALVDWSAGVPVSMKLRGNTGKYLMRKAIEPWLPAGFLNRPKQGFAIPLATWIGDDLGRHAESVWRDSGLMNAGLLNAKMVDLLFAQHRAGHSDHSTMLFSLAIFAHWWQIRLRS
jgi:asparagine synthase (glutamine-hydrolysing)